MSEAVEFLEKLSSKEKEKVYYNLKKAQFTKDNSLFKKLNENIWEFRTLYNGKSYRLFSFWDKSTITKTIVIATHGLVKKSQKIPSKEIKKADDIRKRFIENETKKE